MAQFRELLAGAHSMDVHFANADFADNLPVLLGLLAVWNSTFLHIHAHTVLPYDGRLGYLPSYLTQLEMESNGKSVTHDGERVDYDTCPILWGEIGSNAQHAFYQLLHQGTQHVSCDFIACVRHYRDEVKMPRCNSNMSCRLRIVWRKVAFWLLVMRLSLILIVQPPHVTRINISTIAAINPQPRYLLMS